MMIESSNGMERDCATNARPFYARHAGRYSQYANGDVRGDLWDSGGSSGRRYGFADRVAWDALRAIADRTIDRTPLDRAIRVLDAGCGDLTWAIRLADYFEGMGRPYEIRGLDLTDELIRSGEAALRDYQRRRGRALAISCDVGDLERPLPYESGRFDLTLTLFTVLNHLRRESLAVAVGELLRVTRLGGRHFSIVKAPGGERTAYACDVADVRECRQEGDRLVVTEHDGAEHAIVITLLGARELSDLVRSRGGKVVDLFGIDLFVSAVLARHRASPFDRLPGEDAVALEYLVRLDERHRRDPALINFAGHIAIEIERRR